MVNTDFVRLSECSFHACETLESAIQGRKVVDLNGSIGMALADLKRYVGYLLPSLFPTKQLQDYG